MIYQEFIICNPGQKILYKGSTSVTSMHEKKLHPYKEKARCKIFTNSYKNINMNKLISSTFLFCPAHLLPLFFPTNGKETCQRREEALLKVAACPPLL